MSRKGIILAGGSGTRLHPLTIVTSKQLLPVYDKPTIYYTVSTLMLPGVRDIAVNDVVAENEARRLAANEISADDEGLRQAIGAWLHDVFETQAPLLSGAEQIDERRLIIWRRDDRGLPDALRRADARRGGVTIFSYRVEDPQRYGVVEFSDDDDTVVSIEEKRRQPKSNWAAIGIYFYDEGISDRAKSLLPSARAELEITDLNLLYMRKRKLAVERLGSGVARFDAGTHDSLLEAAEFVRVLKHRQGQLVRAPDEIAYHDGWIDVAQLKDLAGKLSKTQYSRCLLENLKW